MINCSECLFQQDCGSWAEVDFCEFYLEKGGCLFV